MLFEDPERVIAVCRPEDVEAGLDIVSEGLSRGLHAAGFFGYELGYCLEPKLRELLQTCGLPEESKAWIDSIEKLTVSKPPYKKIIDAIHAQQQEFGQAAVEYAALRVALSKETPPFKVSTNEELAELEGAIARYAAQSGKPDVRKGRPNESGSKVV